MGEGGRETGREGGRAESVVCCREAQVCLVEKLRCAPEAGAGLGLLMLPVLCSHIISERFIKQFPILCLWA